MNIKELGNILNIPKKYMENEKLDAQMKALSKIYEEDKAKVINQVEGKNNREEAFLYLILNLALITKGNYKKAGISEEIWVNTMKDIKIWQQVYEDKHQKAGILEPKWILQAVDMEIFKLGSLQFEKIKLQEEIKIKNSTIKSGTFILNTHIPKGADFSPEKVEASYKQARKFFGINIFVCDSWLLSPVLKELLPNNSNILNFQSKYEIIEKEIPHAQMEERVFGSYKENKLEYQEITKLQKSLKKYLLKGKAVGIAKGIML